MIDYNSDDLLIFIHIPKTAGTTVRTVFDTWFDGKLHAHYFNNQLGEKPVKLNNNLQLNGQLIYGHFNSKRGFGLKDYYPTCSQFVTILRDPLNATVSRYYHLLRNQHIAYDKSRIPNPNQSIYEWIMNTPPNMLDHLPSNITKSNYKEILSKNFVEIGITEYLEESMVRIASKLNKPFSLEMLPRLNSGDYKVDGIESLRSEYREKYTLPFDIYDYVAANYKEKS